MQVTTHLTLEQTRQGQELAKVVKATTRMPSRTKDQLVIKILLQLPDDIFDDFVPEITAVVNRGDEARPEISSSVGALLDDDLDKLSGLVRAEIARREADGRFMFGDDDDV
jgi:hypothetical protein